MDESAGHKLNKKRIDRRAVIANEHGPLPCRQVELPADFRAPEQFRQQQVKEIENRMDRAVDAALKDMAIQAASANSSPINTTIARVW